MFNKFNKKTIFISIILIVLILTTASIYKIDKDEIYQVSTINALLEGVYDSNIKINELAKHGNAGIGTFNALDGEMVFLDNEFYQVKSDGKAYLVDKSTKTPFAAVKNFKTDKSFSVQNIESYKQLKNLINKEIETKNIFYAVKITGNFDYVKTRSVPKQNKPYKPLVEVVKYQPEFEFSDVKGTMIGFMLPDYVNKINVPGYHLHFLTQDKKAGGHLLECKIKNAQIEIDSAHSLNLNILNNEDFYKKNIAKNNQTTLEKVE